MSIKTKPLHWFILVILSLFFQCKKKEKPPVMLKTLPVIKVEQRSITEYDDFPTTIEGINNTQVRAKINGYIKQVYVDEGQYVKKGQPLFRIETDMLSQNANAAKSGINSASAQIEAAQARVATAQLEVDRLKPLVAKNIISQVQLNIAQSNLEAALSGLRQAEANKNQAQSNYNSVNANIDYSVIRAPINGNVGSLPFKVGNLVGPNDPNPLTTISDTKELYAYFSMDESQYLNFLEMVPGNSIQEKLKNVPQVDLVLANGKLYDQKGQIKASNGQIDPQTGSIQFRATFSNPNHLITNGNTGTIRIPKYLSNKMIVPESAILNIQGIEHVFKADKDTARISVVKINSRSNNLAVIDEGLNVGDLIIAQGVGTIQNGTAFKPKLISIDSLVNTIKPVFE